MKNIPVYINHKIGNNNNNNKKIVGIEDQVN